MKLFGIVAKGLAQQNDDVLRASRYTLALFRARAEVLEERFAELMKAPGFKGAFVSDVQARQRAILAEMEAELAAAPPTAPEAGDD
ncbi:hypothetical protein D3C72_880500 [compost metagenome]